MSKEIVEAVKALEQEKGISADKLMDALADALDQNYWYLVCKPSGATDLIVDCEALGATLDAARVPDLFDRFIARVGPFAQRLD